MIERESVMGALRERAPRALHVAEICARVGIPKSRRDEMLDVLDQLTTLGLVTEMPGHRFRAKRQKLVPPVAQGTVVGVLGMTPRGFGFVAAEDGGPDVFIPPKAVGAAMHGDRVEVVARASAKGREGEVVAVLARRPRRITGRLEKRGRQTVLMPDDPRLRTPVLLASKPPKKIDDSVTVIAEIEHFPQEPGDVPSAKVIETLGLRGETATEVAKIKLRENVVEEFAEDVLEEAKAFPNRVLAAERKGRRDLRQTDLVTIDPADARDHDDALYCERTDGGGFRVVIAIADVAHYVRPLTAIDRAALERGCSIYLPDRAIPMLPPELSSHLASLVPNKDRLCMGVEVHLSKGGRIEGTELFEGVMRSGGRLTYEGAAQALGLTDDGPVEPQAEKRRPALQALLDLARVLRRRRMRRGALDFDLPEAKVKLDADDEPVGIVQSRQDSGVREAYRMVEEMMLLANEVVAAELKRRSVPGVYRIHPAPDEKKVGRFAQLATALGHDLDLDAARDPKQLSKFLKSIDDDAKRARKEAKKPAGKRRKPKVTEGADVEEGHSAAGLTADAVAEVLRYLLLRAMQQASYSVNPNVGHFGLAAKDYLHFTSPIRRYPDLVVHRVLKKVLRGEPIDVATEVPRMRKAAADSSRLERRAMSVERDVVKLYKCLLMRERIGETFEGSISGVDTHGFWVRFDDPFVEALVPVERLDDYYELDELGIRLIGLRGGKILSLGDRMEVTLEDVRIDDREIIALPVGESGQRRDRDDEDHQPRKRRRTRPSKERERAERERKGGRSGRKGKRKGDGRRGEDKKDDEGGYRGKRGKKKSAKKRRRRK